MSACILCFFFSVCCPLSVFPCRMRVVVWLRPSLHSIKSTLPDFALLYLYNNSYNNFEPLKVVKMKACPAGCWQCGLIMWCVKKWLMTSCRCYASWEISSGRTTWRTEPNFLMQRSWVRNRNPLGNPDEILSVIFLTAKVKFLVPCFRSTMFFL